MLVFFPRTYSQISQQLEYFLLSMMSLWKAFLQIWVRCPSQGPHCTLRSCHRFIISSPCGRILPTEYAPWRHLHSALVKQILLGGFCSFHWTPLQHLLLLMTPSQNIYFSVILATFSLFSFHLSHHSFSLGIVSSGSLLSLYTLPRTPPSFTISSVITFRPVSIEFSPPDGQKNSWELFSRAVSPKLDVSGILYRQYSRNTDKRQ